MQTRRGGLFQGASCGRPVARASRLRRMCAVAPQIRWGPYAVRPDPARPAVEHQDFRRADVRIEKRGDGSLEDLFDLVCAWNVEGESSQESDNRSNPEPRRRGKIVQQAERLNGGRLDAEFLPGFTERRGDDIPIARVYHAARKRDLSLVRFDPVGAPREQEKGLVVVEQHGDQNAGVHQSCARDCPAQARMEGGTEDLFKRGARHHHRRYQLIPSPATRVASAGGCLYIYSRG